MKNAEAKVPAKPYEPTTQELNIAPAESRR
jgi:hypothetical protein